MQPEASMDGARAVRALAWSAAPARRSLGRVLMYVVATRLFLYGVVDYVAHARNPRLSPRALYEFGSGTLASILRWDVWWYVSVAERGYHYDAHQASNVAFLPGFPAVVALVRPLFGSAAIAALVVSNVAFVGAVVALWAWVRDRAGLAVAERAAAFLVVYPFSFFFNTGYSEAIYFLWITLALAAADRDRSGAAAVFTSLATLTRPMGLFLVPAMAWQLARTPRTKPWRSSLLPVLAPLTSLGAYAIYLWVAHGSPLVALHAHRIGWGVGRDWTLFRLARHAEPLRQMVDVANVLLPLPLMWMAFRTLRRIGTVSGVYAILAAALAVLVGGESVGREILSVVPVFATAALVRLDSRMTALIHCVSFALLVLFTYAFALGEFMG